MCGIIGYVGPKDAVPILMEGLGRLEYRGYDSAGVAVAMDGGLAVRRSVGKLSSLRELLAQSPVRGAVGLGHTRWATHGCPAEINAHPHCDCSQRLAVIHNGIIENHSELKAALRAQGHGFKSDTDTEVVVHLIEEKLRGLELSGHEGPSGLLVEATRRALKDVRGAYALAVIWADAPGVIVAAKTASPLVIGLGRDETFLASDVPAFLAHTREAVFLEDGEMAVIRGGTASFCDLSGRALEKKPMFIPWDLTMAQKGGYPHFMLKEIFEQPQAIANTLSGRVFPVNDGLLEREAGLSREYLKTIDRIQVAACGTACHAGMIAKYLLERHARLPVQVETASEFRYREPVLTPSTLVIGVSQSGETADTLAALKLAKQAGAKVLAVCNTVGSAVTRCADFNFYTHCGPERGVASTKAFIGQLAALNVFTIQLAMARGTMREEDALAWAQELERLPELVQDTLRLEGAIKEIAER